MDEEKQYITLDELREKWANHKDTPFEKYVYFPFWRVVRWIKDRPFRFRMFWQRHTRGYSNEECWDLCYHGSKYMLPRLKHLRANLCGHPGTMTEQEWDRMLDIMIYAHETNLALDEKDPDDLPAYGTPEYETMIAKMTLGLELTGRYWRNLWD